MLKFVPINIKANGQKYQAEVMNTASGCLFLYKDNVTYMAGEKWDQTSQSFVMIDETIYVKQSDSTKEERGSEAKKELKSEAKEEEPKKKVKKAYVMAEFLDEEK